MTKLNVTNMQSAGGNSVPNQFIISYSGKFKNSEGQMKTSQVDVFQSYDSIIAKKVSKGWKQEIILDRNYWNYSRTTGKYRNQFLGETIKETESKIKSKEYKLKDLNK